MKINMNIMKKSMTGAFLALAAVSTGNIEPMEACTRAVYIGPEQMVITGRTMDWKEDIMSNIYAWGQACYFCPSPSIHCRAIPVR